MIGTEESFFHYHSWIADWNVLQTENTEIFCMIKQNLEHWSKKESSLSPLNSYENCFTEQKTVIDYQLNSKVF